MERCTTREEFCQQVRALAEGWATEVWAAVVDTTSADADVWVRAHGGTWLRQVLGAALTARADRVGVGGVCACGGTWQFRQHRPVRVHTVVPGRDVATTVVYGQCDRCHRGVWPLLEELGTDAEGFTPALQALATLAGVIEPYAAASADLLERFASVAVSVDKIHTLVASEGARAPVAAPVPPVPPAPPTGPLVVGIDGGMIWVDGRWQEVKLGCLYETTDRIQTPRGGLTARHVTAVRGTPDVLAAQLWPQAEARGAPERQVVVLGDGAPWIWNLAADLFPHRVEILDWYHADEHVSEVARILYGEGTEKAATWRAAQLDRLWTDRVDQALDALRFLGAHQRTAAKRTAVEDLTRYLTTNRDRMRYQTFRAAGFPIGSGAVESAVSHVVQQRMKRVGMRWRAAGADAMLALRAIYRSTGAWDRFCATRRAA